MPRLGFRKRRYDEYITEFNDSGEKEKRDIRTIICIDRTLQELLTLGRVYLQHGTIIQDGLFFRSVILPNESSAVFRRTGGPTKLVVG